MLFVLDGERALLTFNDTDTPQMANLSCSRNGSGIQVIELDSTFTKFGYSSESSRWDIVSSCLCSDWDAGCTAIVDVEYPNLFRSWQQACDGMETCSFHVLPAYMNYVCHCDASEPCLAGCLSISYECIDVNGT